MSEGVAAITCGHAHSLALSDGTVWGWGYNIDGRLGEPTAQVHSELPVQVIEKSPSGAALAGISLIAAGGLHSVEFEAGGDVRAWGFDDRGQLGN